MQSLKNYSFRTFKYYLLHFCISVFTFNFIDFGKSDKFNQKKKKKWLQLIKMVMSNQATNEIQGFIFKYQKIAKTVSNY